MGKYCPNSWIYFQNPSNLEISKFKNYVHYPASKLDASPKTDKNKHVTTETSIANYQRNVTEIGNVAVAYPYPNPDPRR